VAIPTLTDEQIARMTLAEKDRWWRDNVFRGDVPQLTLRAAATGFVLGGLLSATNLYVGAKTGWSLGVGLTSVILAFAAFKAASRLRLGKDFTILEANAMQSIATAAGYMTMPLISSLAAYMMVSGEVIPWHRMLVWNTVLSLLGVVVAFPLKRRFINDEQQPFPEGRACGVVLDTLYTSDAAVGLFKAKALMVAAAVAGGIKFLAGEALMTWTQARLLGRQTVWHLHEELDHYYHELATRFGWGAPRIAGIDVRELGLRPTLDLAMFGAGGLMGMRTTASLLLGSLLNFAVIAPTMIHAGEIKPRVPGTLTFGRVHIVNTWSLWWGIAIMVAASLTALFARPKVIIGAFAGLFRRRQIKQDDQVLSHIELPLSVSFMAGPILGVIAVALGHAWFGVHWLHGLLALPLIVILTLIAANATALTSITPTGALSKITQFSFGALRPDSAATNLMTAGMTSEVAGNASNLLMDIKPGYMLGAKPRQQAIGHAIGIVAGALASTPLFFALFLPHGDPSRLVTEQYPMPSAVQWRGIAELIARGVTSLPASAQIAMLVAALAGIALEIARIVTRNRVPLSALAIGLGVVIPPDSTFAMFAGALFFFVLARRAKPGTRSHHLWVDTQEPICAGLIAGAALVGITDTIFRVFVVGN
jgi:uncharacterized oligopeptide transporter (OPT) family protein